MAYIGKSPAAAPLTSSDVADGIITSAKIADSTIASADIASGVIQSQNAFKNMVINGDMQIAQRGTSTASITGNGYHTIDRFNTINTTLGTWTQSQDTDVPTGQGFTTSLKMDCTTADASPASGDRLDIQQRFEGQQLQHLKKGTSSAESLTLSFWVKAVKTGTNIVELWDSDNTRQISKSYTVDSTNTWEQKEITFAGDTTGALGNDNGNSLQVSWFLAVGSDLSSGTLNTSWVSNTSANRAVGQVNHADSTSNNFWITGVQLEVGTTASDFEHLPYDVNLARCQRYYQSSFEKGVTPGNNEANYLMQDCSCYADNNCYFGTPLFCEMRADPTCVYYTGNNSSSAGNKFTYFAESGWTNGTAANAVLTDKYISAHGSITASHNYSILLQYNYTFDSEL